MEPKKTVRVGRLGMGELLKRYLGPYKTRAAIGVAAKSVEVVFDLFTPLVVARMIDVGVAGHDVGAVVRYGAILMALALVGYGFTLICQKLASAVSQGMGTDIRQALFTKVNELSAAELDQLGTASLVTRITSDVNQLQVAVALAIRQGIRWPFLALGSMIAAMLIDARLGLVFVVCTPAIGAVFWAVMSRSVPLFRQIQGNLDALTRVTSENLSGARVIRAFGREDSEEARFTIFARQQTEGSIMVGLLSAFLNPSTFLILNLGVVAILWSGALRVDAGGLTQGEVVAFVNYMTQTLLAIVYVANLVVTFTRGAASGQRIMDVLRVIPQVQDAPEGTPSITLEKSSSIPALTLNQVSFAYPEASQDALHNVSLTLNQGSRLGVIGGTGSGKSTLASLLVRLYDPHEGTIQLLGHDLREYPLDQLRSLVSIVPQKASLVTGTIRSNLQWRDAQASDDELWEALERAQAAGFVREKPLGLDEPVEAGGKNFSGGQRQRLTIARALVGHPALLVLDDSASALDMATDAKLRSALAEMSDVTTVTISQRITSIMNCDLILVLYHGKLAGLGTHDELLRTCELYREIASSQLMREEVAA